MPGGQAERLGKIVSGMIITIGEDAFLIEAQINDDEDHSPARLSIRLHPRRADQTDSRECRHIDHAGCVDYLSGGCAKNTV
jgi:hypothetical protein